MNSLFSFLNVNSILFSFIELYLILIILLIFLFCIYYYSNRKLVFINRIIIFLYIIIFFLLINQELFINNFLNSLFYINKFLINMKIFVTIFMILYSLSLEQYFYNENIKEYEIIILLGLSIFSGFLIISSINFISFFIAIELQSLIFYILTSLKKNYLTSLEASIKYFILGALASCLLIFGISLIYFLTGFFTFYDFERMFIYIFIVYEKNYFFYLIFLVSLFFILISLFLKIGLAPFHMWLPDVYEGAPTFITLFFILFPKIFLFIFLFKFLLIFNYTLINFHFLFIIIGLFSIFIGTISALLQYKIKRLLAYSTINHLGFMFIILSFKTYFSLIIFCLYLFVYLFLNLGIFIILLSLRFNNNQELKLIQDFKKIFNSNYFILIVLISLLFSLAGIPPLSGFFPKMYIILYLLKYKYYLILIFLILMSVIAAYYYINIINILNFKIDKKINLFNHLNLFFYYILSLIMLFNFFFIFFNNDFIHYFQNIILFKI